MGNRSSGDAEMRLFCHGMGNIEDAGAGEESQHRCEL